MDSERVKTGSRALAIGGLTFIVCFTAGFVLLGELLGQFGDSDQTFVDYYADESNRWRDIAGVLLLTAAGLSLLAFLHGITRRLRASGSSASELDLALLSGAIGVTLLLTGAATTSAVSAAQAFGDLFGDDALTNPSIALAPQIGYLLPVVPTLWALALAIGLHA